MARQYLDSVGKIDNGIVVVSTLGADERVYYPLLRRLRDGHRETWWATDATLGVWGPHQPIRLVVATTDPATLPERSTWYLVTNRPRPDSPHPAEAHLPPADLAEIVRCYGLRTWVEQDPVGHSEDDRDLRELSSSTAPCATQAAPARAADSTAASPTTRPGRVCTGQRPAIPEQQRRPRLRWRIRTRP